MQQALRLSIKIAVPHRASYSVTSYIITVVVDSKVTVERLCSIKVLNVLACLIAAAMCTSIYNLNNYKLFK